MFLSISGGQTVHLHRKLYKGASNVSAINSKTVGHKDLRFGEIVYKVVFYNLSFSWLLPLNGFHFIFVCRVYCVTVKMKNCRFSHDVTKIQTTKLSIPPRFYFHDVLEQLKTNFHTSFRFKRVLGFVIEYA